MTLTADILARMKVVQTGSNDYGGPAFTPNMEFLLQLADGTAANQADIAFFDERTVGDGSNDDIDLAGALTDFVGATITMVELVGFFLINKPKAIGATANTTNLTVGNATNPFVGFLGGTTPTLGPFPPGACCMLLAPGAAGLGTVTATTADELRIANSAGAAATYQLGLLGRTA